MPLIHIYEITGTRRLRGGELPVRGTTQWWIPYMNIRRWLYYSKTGVLLTLTNCKYPAVINKARVIKSLWLYFIRIRNCGNDQLQYTLREYFSQSCGEHRMSFRREVYTVICHINIPLARIGEHAVLSLCKFFIQSSEVL